MNCRTLRIYRSPLKIVLLAAVGVISLSTLFAQQRPAFEVASIKVSEGGFKIPPSMSMNRGGITFTNVTTLECIVAAYGVKDYQVAGPDWLKSDRYVIAARTAAPATDDEIRTMLRTLIEDRFKLAFHRETKDLDVYVISEAKGGARLRPAEGGPENSLAFKGTTLTFRNYSMTALVKFLSSLPSVDRPISDLTGLHGNFDFDIRVDAPGEDPASVKRAMLAWETLFADMGQQLGLKVDARKAPAEMLVVDHIEKPEPN